MDPTLECVTLWRQREYLDKFGAHCSTMNAPRALLAVKQRSRGATRHAVRSGWAAG